MVRRSRPRRLRSSRSVMLVIASIPENGEARVLRSPSPLQIANDQRRSHTTDRLTKSFDTRPRNCGGMQSVLGLGFTRQRCVIEAFARLEWLSGRRAVPYVWRLETG